MLSDGTNLIQNKLLSKYLRKVLKKSQRLYKHLGKQYTYMHQVVYNNKLEYKCTLIPLVPRLLYVGPYTARDTCLLGIPIQIRTAACLYYVYYV